MCVSFRLSDWNIGLLYGFFYSFNDVPSFCLKMSVRQLVTNGYKLKQTQIILPRNVWQKKVTLRGRALLQYEEPAFCSLGVMQKEAQSRQNFRRASPADFRIHTD